MCIKNNRTSLYSMCRESLSKYCQDPELHLSADCLSWGILCKIFDMPPVPSVEEIRICICKASTKHEKERASYSSIAKAVHELITKGEK